MVLAHCCRLPLWGMVDRWAINSLPDRGSALGGGGTPQASTLSFCVHMTAFVLPLSVWHFTVTWVTTSGLHDCAEGLKQGLGCIFRARQSVRLHFLRLVCVCVGRRWRQDTSRSFVRCSYIVSVIDLQHTRTRTESGFFPASHIPTVKHDTGW